MVKNNKANRMHPANSKYTSTEFAAENTAANSKYASTEFAAENTAANSKYASTEFAAENTAANSKYASTEFAAENTAADTEFGQEAAGTAGAACRAGAAGVTGTQKGIVQKVQETDRK